MRKHKFQTYLPQLIFISVSRVFVVNLLLENKNIFQKMLTLIIYQIYNAKYRDTEIFYRSFFEERNKMSKQFQDEFFPAEEEKTATVINTPYVDNNGAVRGNVEVMTATKPVAIATKSTVSLI